MKSRSLVMVLMLLTPGAGPAMASFDGFMQFEHDLAASVPGAVGGTVPATWAAAAQVLVDAGVPPSIATNPGLFLDALVESSLDVPGAPEVHGPLTPGAFLWNVVSSGGFYGLHDYQRVPFIRDVARLNDCADWGCPELVNSVCIATPDWTGTSWSDFERWCAKTRLAIAMWAVTALLFIAIQCGCVDHAYALDALARLFETTPAWRLTSLALRPETVLAALAKAAEGAGLAAGTQPADNLPSVVPTITTTVAVTLAKALHPGDACTPAVKTKAKALDPPAPEPGFPAYQRSIGAAVGFDYAPCGQPTWLDNQFTFATFAALPSSLGVGESRRAAAAMTSGGDLPEAYATRCPDMVRSGCTYTQRRAGLDFIDPAGGLFTFDAGGYQQVLQYVSNPSPDAAAAVAALSDAEVAAAVARMAAAAEDPEMDWLWMLPPAAFCIGLAAWNLKHPPGDPGYTPWNGVMLEYCIVVFGCYVLRICIVAEPDWVQRWYTPNFDTHTVGPNGELAVSGFERTDAPALATSIWAANVRLIRAPTDQECPRYNGQRVCWLNVLSSVTFSLDYPPDAGAAVSHLDYIAFQALSHPVTVWA